MTTWRALAEAARAQGLPAHETRIVLAEAAGVDYHRLVARLDCEADAAAARRAAELTASRVEGTPLQHVLGHWSFRHLELEVDARALVPRPETELVAERALGELARRRAAGSSRRLAALDLGTGSGAIACSIAAETDDTDVVATDVSTAALDLARTNRALLAPAARERLHLVASDWFAALAPGARFDCIVANPPYLSEAEWPKLASEVRDHDPYLALVAGPGGLEAIAEIVAGSVAHLRANGALVLEIAPHQSDAVAAIGASAGAATDIALDFAGRERIAVLRW